MGMSGRTAFGHQGRKTGVVGSPRSAALVRPSAARPLQSSVGSPHFDSTSKLGQRKRNLQKTQPRFGRQRFRDFGLGFSILGLLEGLLNLGYVQSAMRK